MSSHIPRQRTGGALLLAGLAIVFAAAVSAPTVPASPAGDPDRGRVVYDQYCISCHGDTGRGDGPAALGLSPRPASLISASTSAKSDKDLLQIIAAGKPRTAMQAWNGTLTPEEQRDVLAYIRSLVRFTPSLPTPIPGAPRR
ncbi:MAG: cytochrome c [Nitrospiraceae bacterium]